MPVLKYWDGDEEVSVGGGSPSSASGWYPGDLKMTFLSSAPPGWLICDGALVAQATYPALYAAIGHSANGGADPGGGNFKLPDLRKKFPLGKAASGVGSIIGGTGGSNDGVVVSHNHIQDSHNHTQDAHDHAITDPGHEHAIDGDYGNRVNVSATGAQANSLAGPADPGTTFSDIDANTTGITVNGETATNQAQTATNQAQGVSGTDVNMPAFQVVNYMIKT